MKTFTSLNENLRELEWISFETEILTAHDFFLTVHLSCSNRSSFLFWPFTFLVLTVYLFRSDCLFIPFWLFIYLTYTGHLPCTDRLSTLFWTDRLFILIVLYMSKSVYLYKFARFIFPQWMHVSMSGAVFIFFRKVAMKWTAPVTEIDAYKRRIEELLFFKFLFYL